MSTICSVTTRYNADAVDVRPLSYDVGCLQLWHWSQSHLISFYNNAGSICIGCGDVSTRQWWPEGWSPFLLGSIQCFSGEWSRSQCVGFDCLDAKQCSVWLRMVFIKPSGSCDGWRSLYSDWSWLPRWCKLFTYSRCCLCASFRQNVSVSQFLQVL